MIQHTISDCNLEHLLFHTGKMPDFLPSMAGAPSVQSERHMSRVNLRFEKKSSTMLNISIAFVVVIYRLQNRNTAQI